MTNDYFSEKESVLSNFSRVFLYLFPTHHHTGGDLSYLIFHSNPRGLSVCYYLFFSFPASSFPSHFLSLMILQSVSLVVLFFFKISHHDLKFRSILMHLAKHKQKHTQTVTIILRLCVFYLVNSPEGPRAEDLDLLEFSLFQDAKLGLVGCCSTGR